MQTNKHFTHLFLILFLVLTVGFVIKPKEKITLFMIGDSTMANKKETAFPETGWGQVFQSFFNDKVVVENHAVNGRSSKSFMNEGRWDSVLVKLKKGDYVFIQFGHNDQKDKDSNRYTNPHTLYKSFLRKYIEETRNKGAVPVLLTSVVRRNFTTDGVLLDTHGQYPVAMRDLAKEMGVCLIDMQLLTEQLVIQHGPVASKKLYLHFEAGESPNHPNGVKDDTHLNRRGALLFAGEVARELVKMKHPLSANVVLSQSRSN